MRVPKQQSSGHEIVRYGGEGWPGYPDGSFPSKKALIMAKKLKITSSQFPAFQAWCLENETDSEESASVKAYLAAIDPDSGKEKKQALRVTLAAFAVDSAGDRVFRTKENVLSRGRHHTAFALRMRLESEGNTNVKVYALSGDLLEEISEA